MQGWTENGRFGENFCAENHLRISLKIMRKETKMIKFLANFSKIFWWHEILADLDTNIYFREIFKLRQK